MKITEENEEGDMIVGEEKEFEDDNEQGERWEEENGMIGGGQRKKSN
jgi:hypothetical protein